MAITLLANGVSSVQSGTSLSTPVPLLAGSNRMLIAAHVSEVSPSGGLSIGGAYNGVAMSVASDGVTAASRNQTSTSGASTVRIIMRAMREAQLPVFNGTYDLTATIVSGTVTEAQGAIAWWLLNGVEQPPAATPNVASVGLASSNSVAATNVFPNVAAGVLGDAVFILGIKKDAVSLPTLAINGVPPITGTDFDVSLLGGLSSRSLGGRTLSVPAPGQPCSFGNIGPIANQAAVGIAMRLRAFVAPVPGEVSMTLNQPWSCDVGWMP